MPAKEMYRIICNPAKENWMRMCFKANEAYEHVWSNFVYKIE